MNTEKTSHVSTLLKLYAPKEVGITLVPLQDVEQAESSAFWSSIFLMILSLILGSLLPLLLTGYENTPVIWILGAAAILFFMLSATFIVMTFIVRKKAREAAIGPEKEDVSTDSPELVATKGLLMTLYTLNKHVFRGAPTLTKEQFIKRVPEMFSSPIDQAFAQQVYNDMIEIGSIETFESDTNVMYVRPSLAILESVGLQDVKFQKS